MEKELKEKITNERIELFDELMEDIIPKNFSEWLKENGFFTQVASTKYHGAYAGGLFDHSYEVTKALVDMTKKMNLKWKRPESPYIVGMFHDLCKIDSYIKTDDRVSKLTKVDYFDYNPNCILTGHAEKSIMLLSQFITLTEEEILCIRFHMGAYEGKEQWDNYDKAIKKYETVLFTHTADMYASKVKGK